MVLHQPLLLHVPRCLQLVVLRVVREGGQGGERPRLWPVTLLQGHDDTLPGAVLLRERHHDLAVLPRRVGAPPDPQRHIRRVGQGGVRLVQDTERLPCSRLTSHKPQGTLADDGPSGVPATHQLHDKHATPSCHGVGQRFDGERVQAALDGRRVQGHGPGVVGDEPVQVDGGGDLHALLLVERRRVDLEHADGEGRHVLQVHVQRHGVRHVVHLLVVRGQLQIHTVPQALQSALTPNSRHQRRVTATLACQQQRLGTPPAQVTVSDECRQALGQCSTQRQTAQQLLDAALHSGSVGTRRWRSQAVQPPRRRALPRPHQQPRALGILHRAAEVAVPRRALARQAQEVEEVQTPVHGSTRRGQGNAAGPPTHHAR